MRALVLDDSRTARAIVTALLEEAGLEVVAVADGRAGLARLESDPVPFDVALVDWNMPVVDGLSFVRAVRTDPRYASLRMMMITTATEKEQVVAALEAGADEYLMKPFTGEMVLEKLALLGLEIEVP